MGDWLALDGESVLGTPRAGLAAAPAAAGGDGPAAARRQPRPRAARVRARPARHGRSHPAREALAWDAGAHPILVLTKATSPTTSTPPWPRSRRSIRARAVVTASPSGSASNAAGACRATSVMLGESGAGKSSLVNAVLGTAPRPSEPCAPAMPRPAHPTNRQLHRVPGRRSGDRLARHPRGRPGRRRGVGGRHLRRHRRARRGVPLRRLRARGRARLRHRAGDRGRGDARSGWPPTWTSRKEAASAAAASTSTPAATTSARSRRS